MAKRFHELRERLLLAGVALRHVRRYLAELSDHLADLTAEEERSGLSRVDAEDAAFARLGGTDQLASAMIDQRQFQSWCVRAPWVTFGLAPIVVLAAAWSAALFILWSGWQVYLPAASTPFGAGHYRLLDAANLYFQFGRSIYLGAPIVVGWCIALIAARQRLRAIWPAVGMFLVALLGGAGHVHGSRADQLYHVRMGFTLAPGVQGRPFDFFHAGILLAITALPYLLWRLQRAFRNSM